MWVTDLQYKIKLLKYCLREKNTEVLHLGYKIYTTSARLKRWSLPFIEMGPEDVNRHKSLVVLIIRQAELFHISLTHTPTHWMD